ncbi:hypothetical protein LIER_43713 [Lithospermum erythrorhizon]|uniref:Glucose-1-phosphate adenylyltransferase n=1 Tax=Lithospermum erythrorhizon TaxID=34254 RepID=A0AAV3QR16_LITER
MTTSFTSLKSTTYFPTVSRGGGSGGDNLFLGEKIRLGLNNCVWINQLNKSLKVEKKGKNIKSGVAFSVITTKNGRETLNVEAPRFERRKANPKNVAAIILGGGAGAQLFPLTSRTTTPAEYL